MHCFINGFMPLSYYRQEAFCKSFLYYFYWWYSMWKDLVLLYFQCEIILFLSLQNRVLTIVNRSVHYCRLFCLQQSAALLTVVGNRFILKENRLSRRKTLYLHNINKYCTMAIHFEWYENPVPPNRPDEKNSMHALRTMER